MRTLLSLFAASTLAVVLLAGSGDTAHATYGTPGYGNSGHGNVHCVRYGETLYGIAYSYGTTAQAIAHANGIYNPNYVRAGQCLRIPAGHGMKAPAPMPKKHYAPAPMPKKHYAAPAKKMGGYYCVRYGDTLSAIAWRHGTSAWAIANANGIYNPNHIRAGQCLTIPGH
jgi:LysM repeat protein